MGAYSGPEIVNDGIVLHIDAGNPQSYAGTDLEVEYLIVAGGGGGGSTDGGGASGGGGGAGGLIFGSTTAGLLSYAITVGAGGTGGTGGIDDKGDNGTNTTAFGLTALGGGGGGGRDASSNNTGYGRDGGSGGGEGSQLDATGAGSATQPGSASGGYGNNGGEGGGVNSGDNASGGGGGAGGVGGIGVFDTRGGNGGIGLNFSSQFGTTVGENGWFAGGGGGGIAVHDSGGDDGGDAGLGGGGRGGAGGVGTINTLAQSGQANTGGGGGGAGGDSTSHPGGSGGSGVVIVRYKGPQKATGGDSIYQRGVYTVHAFNNSGNFVVGSTAGDISYNENAAVLTNGVAFYNTNEGLFDFDGANDYIETNFGNGRNPATNPISYSLWVYQDSVPNQMYLVQGNWSSAARAYFGVYNGKWGMGIQGASWTGLGSAASSNTWYHITIVFDGSNCKLYVNGEYDFQRSYTSYSFNQTLQVGGTTHDLQYMWNGKIHGVTVYDKALTAAEVAQNFAAIRGRFGV